MKEYRTYGIKNNGELFYEAWESMKDWTIEDMIIRCAFNNKFYKKWNIEYR